MVQSGSRRGPEISDFWDNRSDVLNETTTSTRETVVSAAFEQRARLILCHDPAKTVESPSARDERAMMSDRVVTGEVAGEGSSSYGHSDLVQS
ncbi:hypothetical protein ARMGADRAFT_1010100 [Armillaria gallica]|uniref:Uncharacterized protein n=1 Tax=Armillaria gallica TaxID=47427 RepID=A0A2H3E9V7_ARMGA|nr:hypothetical protein ARMGADRAFT_1010100 [Armillaria gallica]